MKVLVLCFVTLKEKMDFVLPQNNELLHYGKFYKFLSVKSALKTLQSGTLWYSNPTIFNDPLDCSELLFNFKTPNTTSLLSKTSCEKEIVDDFMKMRYGLSMKNFINSIDHSLDLKNFNGSLSEEQAKEVSQNIMRKIFSKEEIEKYRIINPNINFRKEYLSDAMKSVLINHEDKIKWRKEDYPQYSDK